ncbi:MAG: hypothetical protein R3C14_11815 [Caldilineaceae bacterium]
MSVGRGSVVRVIGIALIATILVACQSAAAQQALSAGGVTPTPPPADVVVWGRVPYCNCLATSATANVTNALQEAHLTVSLKELSPRDGWLYFAVTFEPQAATTKQVGDAMTAGGAEVIAGPP